MSVSTITALERTKFVDEFKEDFERTQTILKRCVRSDGLMSAGTIKWDVVALSEEAQTRTRNGDIPESELGLSQVTGTPKEHFMKYRIDSFDAFRSNPNVRAMQYKKSLAATNRAIDREIVTQADTATNIINSGNAISFAVLSTFLTWTTELWKNDVPADGNVYGLITPAAYAQMMRINEFKSLDFTRIQGVDQGVPMQGEMRSWLGVKWIMFTGLTNRGTATAKCHLFHQSAIGHQIAGDPEVHAYYYEAQDRSEVWSKVWHVGKLCLQRGIVSAIHDDTAAFA